MLRVVGRLSCTLANVIERDEAVGIQFFHAPLLLTASSDWINQASDNQNTAGQLRCCLSGQDPDMIWEQQSGTWPCWRLKL